MKCSLVALALASRWLFSLSMLGAQTPVGYTMSCFDGGTLAGWQVAGCEASVDQGAILLKAGNGIVRTDYRYGDFVLELDWKALKPDNWDSGVFFRAELPAGKRPWPNLYQANLRKGMEGNVQDLQGASSTGLARPGEWNHFKLTVIGDAAALEINGRPAWKARGVKAPSGYIALQAEVPGGGQFLFRNLKITESGYESLFNGKDLTGWEPAAGGPAGCWKVADGLLVCTGKRGSWLRSAKQYGDFNLRLEYRLKPGGNSGVYVRVPAKGAHHGKDAGIEVQILDDGAPRYAGLKPYQFSASLYAIVPAKRASLPPGQWNRMEIDCRGTRYRVVHNGALVIDASAEQHPELRERLREGFLGLQNHSDEVQFRNLRIGPSQAP